MPDIYLGEFDTDITPPHLENPFPADLSVDVERYSNITFDLIDGEGSGVDLSSVVITIDGDIIFQNGSSAPGWSVISSLIPMTTGDYSFTVDKVGLFAPGAVISVDVDAADLSEIPNEMDTYSWSFTVTEGAISSPRLNARAMDSAVYLSWTIDPEVIYIQFELRRSTVSFPVDPMEGELVYEGNDFSFTDSNVVNRITYYYTIFVHRTTVLDQKVYIPYEQIASDSAMPRRIDLSQRDAIEYVPFRGEFGGSLYLPIRPDTNIIYGEVRGVKYDIIKTSESNPQIVASPVNGVVHDLSVGQESGDIIEIHSDIGNFSFKISGILLDQQVVAGSRISGGVRIGFTTGKPVSFYIEKRQSGPYPARPVRPSYFYIEVERRDGA